MNETRWLPSGAPHETAKVRLFCFPFAGGGASTYRTWRKALGPEIEVCPVQPPGRESRIREDPFRRLEPLVETVAVTLRPWLAWPFALFGHSMGALIAYELARFLPSLGLPGPLHLFVSGATPPHRRAPSQKTHALPDDAFKSALRDLDGTPEAVLAHPELMDLMLPTLRADFEMCETYAPAELERLACPITAFGGSEDAQVSPGDLTAWSALTRAGFEACLLAGDHFFLGPRAGEILERIAGKIGSPSEDRARTLRAARGIEDGKGGR